MPRVPTYDEFQSSAQVTGPTRYDAPMSTEMASMPGRQQAQMGEAMMRAGNAVSQIALDIQKDVNEAATKQADNVVADQLRTTLYDPDNGYLSMAGEKAITMRQFMREQVEESIKKAGDGLTNDVQRRMFQDVAQRRMQMALQQIDGHAAQQTKVFNETETAKRADNARKDAVANYATWNMGAVGEDGKRQPTPFTVARDTMIAEANKLAQLKGFGPDSDVAKSLRDAELTKLHQQVITTMLAGDKTKDARAYYEANSEQIDPEARDDLKKMLNQAGAKQESLDLFRSLKGGFSEQRKEVDRLYGAGKISPEVYDMTMQRVEHQYSIVKAQQAEGEKSLIGGSMDWFIKNPGRSILDFQTANPQAYNQLVKTGHIASIVGFAKSNGKVENDPATWADVMTNQQDLKGMTPTEIYNRYRFKLDDQHLEKLYALNAAMNGSKDEQHLYIQSTTDLVKGSAQSLGILPYKGKPSESQSKDFDEFQNAVQSRVAAFEASTLQGKRKASQDELRKILQEVEMDKVYRSRIGPDKSGVPMVTVKPNEMPDVYVKVGDEEIYVSQIPVTQRSLIINALRAAGKAATEQNIAEYWVRGGKKK